MSKGRRTMSQIDEHLFLGSAADAADEDGLHARRIRNVLSLMSFEFRTRYPGITYKSNVVLPDAVSANIAQHFDECYEFIRAAEMRHENVLVHCLAGVSRSATVVIAYLMKKYRLSTDEALRRVMERRMVSPNPGFCQQLRQYERHNYTYQPPSD